MSEVVLYKVTYMQEAKLALPLAIAMLSCSKSSPRPQIDPFLLSFPLFLSSSFLPFLFLSFSSSFPFPFLFLSSSFPIPVLFLFLSLSVSSFPFPFLLFI